MKTNQLFLLTGLAAVTLPACVQKDKKGVSEKPMNILYINIIIAVESRCWTDMFGVNQCIIAAKNAVLDSFGVKIEEATIEQVLRYGTADIGKPYLNCITAVVKWYVADIFATLRRYEYYPELMRL